MPTPNSHTPFEIRVTGISKVMADLKKTDAEAAVAFREALRHVGESVRRGSQERTDGLLSPESALGYRVYVRKGGAQIDVEQSLGRTTGKRRDWAASQMRWSLIPSLEENELQAHAAVDIAISEVVKRNF